MLKRITIDNNIKAVIEEPIPRHLIQTRQISGTKLDYVSGNFVIDTLNRAFGYAWSWSIDKEWIQPSEPKRYKDKNTGKEIVTPQVPVAHVIGTLTVFLQDGNGGIVQISKSGAGSKSVIGGASEQESLFKSASTDALKKAASLLGIAAQLYREPREQEYFDEMLASASWDEEAKEMFKDDIAWLDKCKKDNGFDDAYMDTIVASWSSNRFRTVNSLPPYKFSSFIAYLKEAQKSATTNEE